MSSRCVVVVGGSKGIGRAIVGQELEGGATLTVLSRTSEDLDGLDGVSHITWDATSDELSAEQLPESIDGLVYCPGSLNLRVFPRLKPETFRDDFDVNVIGAVKSIQAALPALKASGDASIVLFSTVAVAQGMHAHASIAASKGAIEGLTRSLAAELSPSIRVNCIAPALTDTSLTQKFFRDPDRAKALGEKYALGRTGTAKDIAHVASMLLGESGCWMTGQVIGVDGGMSSVRK